MSGDRPTGLVPGSGQVVPPKGYGRVVSVRLTPEEYAFLLWRAEQGRTTISDQIREALRHLPSIVWKRTA